MFISNPACLPANKKLPLVPDMKGNISIIRATVKDSQLLAGMGRITFLEAHGNSASAEIVTDYVDQNYSETVITTQLNDPGNLYHLIYYSGAPAGYSKIIYNTSNANISSPQITKLERIYLLKEYYGLDLGRKLLEYNIGLSKKQDQSGMWLFVWKENHRAINFYNKAGFKIIGSHDFKLSEAHSNPNHLMFLNY